MPVLYYFNAKTQKWEPLSLASGSGTPGPKGDKGDKGDPGDSVKVNVQDSQPAGPKAGDVWISNL